MIPPYYFNNFPVPGGLSILKNFHTAFSCLVKLFKSEIDLTSLPRSKYFKMAASYFYLRSMPSIICP